MREQPIVRVEEHLKIVFTDRSYTGNVITKTTKIVMCRRIK